MAMEANSQQSPAMWFTKSHQPLRSQLPATNNPKHHQRTSKPKSVHDYHSHGPNQPQLESFEQSSPLWRSVFQEPATFQSGAAYPWPNIKMCPCVNFLTDPPWNGDQVSRSWNFRPCSRNSKIARWLGCTLSAVQIVASVPALKYQGRNGRVGKCPLPQVTTTEDHGGKFGWTRLSQTRSRKIC
jgi:hypothetical protein